MLPADTEFVFGVLQAVGSIATGAGFFILWKQLGQTNKQIGLIQQQIGQTNTQINNTHTQIGQTNTQIELTRQQIGQTQQQIDANLRPWVAPLSDGYGLAVDKDVQYRIAFWYTNYGTLPPNTLSYSINVNDQVFQDENAVTASGQTKSVGIVFPNEKKKFVMDIEVAEDRNHYDAARRSERDLFFGIRLEYTYGNNKTGVYWGSF